MEQIRKTFVQYPDLPSRVTSRIADIYAAGYVQVRGSTSLETTSSSSSAGGGGPTAAETPISEDPVVNRIYIHCLREGKLLDGDEVSATASAPNLEEEFRNSKNVYNQTLLCCNKVKLC